MGKQSPISLFIDMTYLESPIMDEVLMDWLRNQWRLATINKYRHLFDEWVKNITPEQISGFRHNMLSDYVNHEK